MVNNASEDLLWTLTGESGVNWLQGLAPFQSDSPHQIIFEGIRGPTDISDIVIKIK